MTSALDGVDYVPTLTPELAPAWIDHVLRYHGRPTPRTAKDRHAFRYLDLGCGRGVGLIALAAAYPAAEFIGVDASASHISFARRLAAEAGVGNVVFESARFGDAGVAEFAGARYVVANGVYTWVDVAVRSAFRETVARCLAPGGAAVVSANVVTGWRLLAPAQRIFAALAGEGGPDDPVAMVDAAVRRFDAVAAASGDAMMEAGAEEFRERFSKLPAAYVAHEFGAASWRPAWTADLVEDFAAIDLEYVSDARLSTLRDDFAFKQAQRNALEAAASEAQRLNLRDLFLRPSHVHLVFERPDGSPISERSEGWARLEVRPDDVAFECRTPAGALKFDNAVARNVVDALADGPKSIAHLIEQAGASGEPAFYRVLDALMASGQAYPVDKPSELATVAPLNDLLADARINVAHAADGAGTPTRRQRSG